jgi:hypothetical protein
MMSSSEKFQKPEIFPESLLVAGKPKSDARRKRKLAVVGSLLLILGLEALHALSVFSQVGLGLWIEG